MKRYTPIIESDSSCDMFASIEETINGTLVKYSEVDQLQSQLKEAYKKIISDNTKQSIAGGSYCGNCRSLVGYHNDDCIVLKAERWLEENK